MSETATAPILPADPRPREFGPARLEFVDFLRGLVLVIMALDHTRDFFTNLSFDPEDLASTGYALFFTRWITHFCAPLFFFVAGTGSFCYAKRWSREQLTRFLWTRGLWLILLEFTIVGTAWSFKFPWGFFGVIWCLGASMIILSLIVKLPMRWIVWLSLAFIVCHDLFDRIRPVSSPAWAPLWCVLHIKGAIGFFGTSKFVLFPIIPWFAVMSAGYAFGALLQRSDRKIWMRRIGLVSIGAFIVLRITNLYGNPPALPGGVTPGDFHWQPSFEKTAILFFDVEKYPPSLQFLLMTLAPSLLLLGFLDGRRFVGFWRSILTFGRVPMFFYVVHLYLIHTLAILVAIVKHQPYRWLLHGGFWFFDLPEGYGYNLPVVYLLWLAVITLLYLPCAWFAELKREHDWWWLSYL